MEDGLHGINPIVPALFWINKPIVFELKLTTCFNIV